MGLTVLDAGVLIGFLDANDKHHHAAQSALKAEFDNGQNLVMSATAFAEALVGPVRHGPEAVELARESARRLPISILPVSEAIGVCAAELRARHGRKLKLPDALVVATAQVFDADTLVTTDRGWPDAKELDLRGTIVIL